MVVRGDESSSNNKDNALWAALDEWEPESISLDFNRKLYKRVDAFERRRSLLQLFHAAPVIILFALLILFNSSTRPTVPVNGTENSAAASSKAELESKAMAEALSDLSMIQALNSTEPL